LKIAKLSGVPIYRKSPLMGADVFCHRSGIHQHGTEKTADLVKGAYRPINPTLIGRAGDEELRFTSQSGSAAVAAIIREQGEDISDEEARLLQPALKAVSEKLGELEPEELLAAYLAFLELQTKKQHLDPQDLVALAESAIHDRGVQTWKMMFVRAVAGDHPTATISLERDGREFTECALGDGPVDAAFAAINKITGVSARVKEYRVGNITDDADAQAKVSVCLEFEGKQCRGSGASTDTVVASVMAYLDALNRLLRGEKNGNSH
jgi:2-isopropylmalate synthase